MTKYGHVIIRIDGGRREEVAMVVDPLLNALFGTVPAVAHRC